MVIDSSFLIEDCNNLHASCSCSRGWLGSPLFSPKQSVLWYWSQADSLQSSLQYLACIKIKYFLGTVVHKSLKYIAGSHRESNKEFQGIAKKIQKQEGRRGERFSNLKGKGRGRTFLEFLRTRGWGIKYRNNLWLGIDAFWNHPMYWLGREQVLLLNC